MSRMSKILTSLFTSGCLLVALTATACIDESELAGFDDIEAHGVVVRNEFVDDGASSLHTLRGEGTTYAVKITPTGEHALTLTWTVERDGEIIEHAVDYEVNQDPDRGMALVAVDPHAAANAHSEISAGLRGTDIEARLLEGSIDLVEGLDLGAGVNFRGGYCPSWWQVVGACGVTILSLPFATVGGAIVAGAFGPVCAALWIKYNACH